MRVGVDVPSHAGQRTTCVMCSYVVGGLVWFGFIWFVGVFLAKTLLRSGVWLGDGGEGKCSPSLALKTIEYECCECGTDSPAKGLGSKAIRSDRIPFRLLGKYYKYK